MKIAIDTADLDCFRIDGTRVYIQNVLKYLGGLAEQDDFFLFHKKRYNELLRPTEYENYKDNLISGKVWWTQLRFAYEINKLQPDVCWMPIQQIPFRRNNYTKYVITIHDLAFKFFPKHFPLVDRLKINFYTDIAVKQADKIIAISETTKRDIIKLYPKVNVDKIKVVYHGFDGKNFMQQFSEGEKCELAREYGLLNKKNKIDDFLLYVGAIQPRKDLITLVKSFEQLKSEQSGKYKALKLVLVGEVAWKSKKTMEVVKSSDFKNDIVITGKVGFRKLAIFYRLAKVFVFPSLYEGFGIPLLEAMASKTPVVVADNSSLVEVGGDAVLKFESKNVAKLTNQVKQLLDDENFQQKMIARGLERIKKFNWRKCAKETLKVLKSVE